MKFFIGLASLLFLSSPAIAWKVKADTDRLTGKTEQLIVGPIKNIVTFRGRGYLALGEVSIDCDVVVFNFSDIIGGPKNATVTVRADSKQPLRNALTVAPNLRGAYGTANQTRNFLKYINGASNLYGEIQSSTLGVTSFEIDLSGLGPVMRSAGKKCAVR